MRTETKKALGAVGSLLLFGILSYATGGTAQIVFVGLTVAAFGASYHFVRAAL